MFCLRRGASARRSTQKRFSSRYRLGKCSLVFAGVSGVVVAYFVLPDQSRSLSKALSPSCFTPATLVSSVQTSRDTKLLTLSLPPELVPRDSRDSTPIWSVCIKDDDIQVERPYTPLEGIDGDGNMSFWIKKYEHGEVGRWLHSKRPGCRIQVRGPLRTWLWRDGVWEDIIMVSGGTGITPFYQLLHGIFSTNDTPDTRFTLLHASKTPADLPPASVMAFLGDLALQRPDKFKLRVFVDTPGGASESRPPVTLTCDRIGRPALEEALGSADDRPWWRRLFRSPPAAMTSPERRVLVLVCGPEQMVNAIAGPYGRNYSQGEVAGVLGQVGLQSHQVWKL